MIDPETYANLIKNSDMHFVATRDDKQLLTYDGGIYSPYGDTAIHSKVMGMTHGAGVTTHRMNEIVNLVRWDNYVNRNDFDSGTNIINMDNGLYNIETGMSPHTPKYLSLHKSPIAYDPDATCPAIDQFIEEIVPKAYISTMYEIGGYAMSPHKNRKRAFIYVGEKNSGKSVQIALLNRLIGDKATTYVSPMTVSNTTYGAAEYYGKQLNLVDDLGNTPITDTGVLKSVISSKSINAQFKYAQPFDYVPNVLCVFATNEVPKIEPFDAAYASRFSIIDFPNTFEGADADRNLIDKLTTSEELSGFFNKCMDALAQLNERDTFTSQKTLDDDVKAYQYQSNPVEQFIDEMCDLTDNEAYVVKATLFRAYTKWAKEHGFPRGHKKDLTIALTERGCGEIRPMGDDNTRQRAYEGVDFKHRISDFA